MQEASDALVWEQARQLAAQLNIPVYTSADYNSEDVSSEDFSSTDKVKRPGLYLRLDGDYLKLGRLGAREHPVFVDFVSAMNKPRRGPELLIKAVGGGLPRPRVIDATAGLGRDSAILMAAGYPVTMIEENPVAGALLDNAMNRLRSAPGFNEHAARISLKQGRAEEHLPLLAQEGLAEVIYLDPMFAVSGKAALVKKEMQLFQSLLGHGPDDTELLERALAAATYRVVVKRALKAPPLADRQPTMAIKGKAVRFDVYALKSFKRQS